MSGIDAELSDAELIEAVKRTANVARDGRLRLDRQRIADLLYETAERLVAFDQEAERLRAEVQDSADDLHDALLIAESAEVDAARWRYLRSCWANGSMSEDRWDEIADEWIRAAEAPAKVELHGERADGTVGEITLDESMKLIQRDIDRGIVARPK